MSVTYKAIIVDDEAHGRENLSILLQENLPEIEVLAFAKEAFEAKTLIESLKPDLVFLDINIGKVNGIDLLNTFTDKSFKTIYVTAYDKYAIEALRAGAVGYVLKPIITEELMNEVKRVCAQISLSPANEDEIPEELKDAEYPESIMINHSKGYFFIKVNDIVRLEALGSYCKVYTQDGETVTTSKTLKKLSALLNPEIFMRIHKTHIVNLNYVKEYKTSGDGTAILKDGTTIKVAVLKRAEFKQRLIAFMQ